MSPSEQDIRNRLLTVRLPAMPQILLKLIELCQSDKTGMAELARLIGNDVGMSTKLLTVANSAAYHRGSTTVDLMQALTALGANTIKTLVISESVFQTFNAFPHCGGADLRTFWQHALKTAVMARAIASRIGYAALEEAYLAGLLHDVGRLALLAAAPNEYSANFRAQDDAHLCTVEQQTLQISHTEAGAWLAERWKFSPGIADSILYHHEPADRLTHAAALTRIVHLADWLSHQDNDAPLADDAGALCALSGNSLNEIRLGAEQQVILAAEYLGIVLPEPHAPVPPPAQAGIDIGPDSATLRLAVGVRDRTLLTEFGLSLKQAASDADLLEVIRTNARLLLQMNDVLLLLWHPASQTLIKVLAPHQAHADLPDLSAAASSALLQAVNTQGVLALTPLQAPLKPFEQQLLNMLKGEALVLIPMASDGEVQGVVVGSVARERLPALMAQPAFMQKLGAHAGQAIYVAGLERGTLEARLNKVHQSYQERSRHVAHEVNNPLAIIKNYLGVVDDKLGRQEDVAHELTVLHEEIDRVGHLVNEFAGARAAAQAPSTDMRQVLPDLVKLFQGSKFLPRQLHLGARLADNDRPVLAAPNTVRQILINLIKNAIEALPHGGHITLVSEGPYQHDGRWFMQVSVQDDGPGLSADVMANLFSPLRSSKPGAHRGIGLTIVHSMLEKLGGSIRCHNSAHGATFVTLFPCTAPTEAQNAASH